MYGLVTDRTQHNVSRRNELSRKGWANMTLAERNEWTGDPLSMTGVNLFPFGENYSSSVTLKYSGTDIVATAVTTGSYLYAVAIVGDAKNYQDKTFTLSVDGITEGGQISAWWHDENGSEYAGATLFDEGSVTFNTAEWLNVENRQYLALYLYVTTTAEVLEGASVTFNGVMLENGAERHAAVPYYGIVPTAATKGAYNYTDLNRVENAVKELSEKLGLTLTTKTDWAMWDIPRSSDMERYLANVKAIREYIGSSTELPDSMDNLTYTDANNIEKILVEAMEA